MSHMHASGISKPPIVAPRENGDRKRRISVPKITAGLLAGALLCADFSPVVLELRNPFLLFLAWVAFAIQTIQFHVGVLLLAAAAVLLIRRRRRPAAIVGVVALICVAPVLLNFLPQRAAPHGTTIRILSLNLRDGGYDPDAVLAQVNAADPDVICFQEYNADGHARLFPLLGSRYPQQVTAPTADMRGTAVFSRVPFLGLPPHIVDFGQHGGPQIVAAVKLDGRPVRLYCVHLAQPMRFSRFCRQRLEVARLLELIDGDIPTIVVGDLNSTNQSYIGSLLAQHGFVDAPRSCGSGPEWSWPTYRRLPWLRLLRIDHVYLSQELSARRAEVLPYAGSDHRPVLVEFGFVPEVKPGRL